MPFQFLIPAAASLLGGALQSRSASKAASHQTASAQAGIDEQRRQFDEIRKLLEPYVAAGQPALQAQQALIGLGGPQAQQQAITGIEQSPLLQELMRQGEQAMLQNASATGGLRGGNLQAALAQFRPAMLQQAIAQQYQRLGGLSSLGQQSAVGVGTAGMQTGINVANLLGQQGQAQAGGTLGRAAPYASFLNLPMQLSALNYGRTGQFGLPNIFGGTPITPQSPFFGSASGGGVM